MKHIAKISTAPRNFVQKSITLFVVLVIAGSQQVLGQLTDNFSDGNYAADPTWNSDIPANWAIEGGSLRSNSSTPSSTFYISTPSLQATNVQWEFFLNLKFKTSGSNYVDVYLISANEDLNAVGNNGYFVRIGGTPDEISLYQISGGIETVLIDGADGITDKTNNTIKIKVIRDADDLWTLSRDITGTGDSYVEEENSVVDNTFSSGNYFGIRITQSTASFFSKHYFDDFYVGDIIVDAIAPQIQSVNVVSTMELDIVFSEDLSELSAETISNYSISQDVENPVTAELLADGKTVHLVFGSPFPNGITSTITVTGVSDLIGNAITSAIHPFLFFQPVTPNPEDIVITEIFADPAPSVALPEAEFIELYNRSGHPFDLAGWQFTDGSSIGNLSSLILLPGEYLILSSTSAASQFEPFGKSMAISPFPSLNNSGDFLVLKDPIGKLIDSVAYLSAWYNDADKEDGGWSLEKIDPDDFCRGALNWKASVHESGGTPGQQNSVYAQVPDITGPKLLSASLSGQNILELSFNETLDKAVPSPVNVTIEPPTGIAEVMFSDDSYSKISLSFSQGLDSTVTYRITLQNIFDCPGNVIQEAFSNVVFKLDTIKPDIYSVYAITQNEIEIVFSEKLTALSAENIENYLVTDFGNPASVTVQSDSKTVTISYGQPFVNGVENTIQINNVQDLAGNVIDPRDILFMFFEPVEADFKDIIISEIFADPSPALGLPEVEFIEVYNRSNHPFDLNGWKFSDESSAVNLSSVILLPNEHLILCPQTKAAEFLSKGKTLGVNGFPSLNNTGEPLVLSDPNGQKVDSINYRISWYKDDEKKDGGWSIELIDPENLCAESENWIASENENGGTPGKQNSVFANKPDLTGPKLLSVFPISNNTVLLRFDEKLEAKLPLVENFSLDPAVRIFNVLFDDASLTSLQLVLDEELHGGMKYQVNVENVYDCAGNIVHEEFSRSTFALPETAQSFDLVINEILFNPRSTGVDFVEVYNQSEKFVNLKDWTIANLENDSVVNKKIIFESDFLVEPKAYVVFTEDGNILKGEYLNGKEETFVKIDLPSFPDAEGSVVLLDGANQCIDSFIYSDRYHSVFLKDEEGVSLERISLSETASEAQNWKSAGSDFGFATPGYLNSNTRTQGVIDETIKIEPEIFIPVNGQPDFTEIKYNFEHGGYVANIKILDRQGREIKTLANNELLGTDGFFRWDGDQENGSKARIGAYMVWFEVFDANGEVKTFRKRVVVAGQLR